MNGEARVGVRSQLLAAVVAIVAVGFALVYTVTMPLLESALREDHRERAVDLVGVIAAAVARAPDPHALEDELDRASATGDGPIVRCVGLSDARGTLTERSAARLAPCLDWEELEAWGATPRPPGDPAGSVAEISPLMGVTDGARWLPDRGAGERLALVKELPPLELPFGPGEHARLVVVSANDGIERRLAAVRNLLLVFLGLAIALTTLIGYAGLTRLIVSPLNRLVRAVDRLHSGDGSTRATVEGGEELGQLATAFNRLATKLGDDEKRIARQFSELRLVNDRLEKAQENLVRSEKLASVGQLAAGVAHEIGNPIAIALGYLELMRRSDTTEEERVDYSRRAVEALDRVGGILRDLLDFSRPERDELPRADAGLAVQQCVQLLGPQPRLRHVVIEAAPLEQPVYAAIGDRRLVQVLVNLVLNAADATAGTTDARVELSVTQGTARVHIRVRDNGPGIPDAIRRQIFNPVFSTKAPGRGTGLGLPICHSIVTSEGGDIVVERTDDNGTTFLLDLPRAD